MAKPYNGHHCWNCWNVALWIGNDEGLYRYALECKRQPVNTTHEDKRPSLNISANRFLSIVGQGTQTPDGGRYTYKAVNAALADLE